MEWSYKLSVVIPIYNAEAYLEECLRSIVKQTIGIEEIEVLLLNDGSSDKSGEICKMWELKYPNIIYCEKNNEGVSATRNLGIQKARGKYILFLDPDDYLSKNAIKDIVSFFDSHYHEIDMVTYPIVFVYPNRKKKMHSRYRDLFANHNMIYDLEKDYRLVQATINVCIKNKKEYQFDQSQVYSEDEQFNTKVLMEKKKLGYVSNTIYYYRQHNSSATSKKNTYDLENIYQFHEKFQEIYHNHPYIQSIILNNFRWRIEEDCLYPDTLPLKEVNQYLESATKRLNKVDFLLFRNYLKTSTMLELLALSNQSFFTKIESDGTCSLFSNGHLLLEGMKSVNEIYDMQLENNQIKIMGRIVTGFYHDKELEGYATLFYIDGKQEQIKLHLQNDLEYQKKVNRHYELEIDSPKISRITFSLFANNQEVRLVTKNVEWCSKYKVLDSYYITITNQITIQKKKFYHRIINKFRSCKKISFTIINLLSLFSREGRHMNVYVGDKDSKLYDIYLRDDNKKLFLTSTKGLKYKLQLLNCDQLITDKKIRFVFPFGNMRELYIEAGRFKVVRK